MQAERWCFGEEDYAADFKLLNVALVYPREGLNQPGLNEIMGSKV